MRLPLSLLLAFVLSLAGTAIANAIEPGVFGSCFEGGCGYAALLVALLGTVVLAPFVWLALRRAGPLSRLLLGFMLFALTGHFVVTFALWLAGLVVLAYAMLRVRRRARAEDSPARAMFIVPRVRT
ncbi:hypothetical protein [Sphingomonas endophytica]|uniref:Lipoprotein n=1 Tax=Sphingomonas endophytica TaxID=869719 RepID=A0A147I6W3_9SPHN|nr:hypothetical protein [Sphingomonas endophytica]KTT74674.1 hypothetical protein NS334_04645 [Sphingomonas endophytica]